MRRTSHSGAIRGMAGSPGTLLPRTFQDLRRLVRRHTDPDARDLLTEVEDQVELRGWRRVRRDGGPNMERFFERAAEVLNEISSAAHEIVLAETPINRLVGTWDFRFPVEDLVLDRLHSRHLGKRIVLIDGDRAFVRDGLGVRMEAADVYAPSTLAMSGPPSVAGVGGQAGPGQPSLGLFDELPGRSSGMNSPTFPN